MIPKHWELGRDRKEGGGRKWWTGSDIRTVVEGLGHFGVGKGAVIFHSITINVKSVVLQINHTNK